MAQAAQARKNTKKDYIMVVGRRKESSARVRLYTSMTATLQIGSEAPIIGDIYVNSMPIATYFPGDLAKAIYTKPFQVTNTLNQYIITIRVAGGGKHGQLEAVVHGIARALDKVDKEKHHLTLRKKGLLTRDARVRERRSIGTGGKARRKKQSPKR